MFNKTSVGIGVMIFLFLGIVGLAVNVNAQSDLDKHMTLHDLQSTVSKHLTSAYIAGTWQCKVFTRFSDFPVGEWTFDPDNLYMHRTATIIFSDDGDGTYSYTTDAPNAFRLNDEYAGFGEYAIYYGVPFITVSNEGVGGDTNCAIRIIPSSRKRMFLENMLHGSSNQIFLFCYRD